jgi:chaperone required for assembly of F1-ATPase
MTDAPVRRRRFYKSVQVSDDNRILLDGRPVKTPLKAALILPTYELAQAVAAEWDAQTDFIDTHAMPLTRLSNTAIDRATAEHDQILREITDYAGSDLVCYRADEPRRLAESQKQAWDHVLSWVNQRFGAKFRSASGIVHQHQDQTSLQAFTAFAAALDPFRLVALHNLMTLTGSAMIAAMLIERAIPPTAAWNAAHVDEDFQWSAWGIDEEAAARRAQRKRNFDETTRLLELVG